MERATLEELAFSRISDLVDHLADLQAKGDEVMMAIVHAEIKDLTSAMDNDEYDFFYVSDYRYLNDYQN